MIKAIAEYDGYFFKADGNGKLYGIDEQGVKKVDVIDEDGEEVKVTDFFTLSGILYFSVEETETETIDEETVSEKVTKYYVQSDGVITEEESISDKPTFERKTFSCSEFSLSDFDHEGTDCTDVLNLDEAFTSGIERFLMVTECLHFTGTGLYVNVTEGRGEDRQIRPRGLYFWPTNDKGIVFVIKGEGELWI